MTSKAFHISYLWLGLLLLFAAASRNLRVLVCGGALGAPPFSILLGPAAPQRQAPTLFTWHVAWRCQE